MTGAHPLPAAVQVHTVRGMGLMCGIVLNFDEDKVEEQAKLLDVDCANRGLLVRMLGSGTMVLSPVSSWHPRPPRRPNMCRVRSFRATKALVITEEEVDKLVGILKDSFVRVTAELGLTFDSVAKNPAKLI
jgi:adenosylmethionine-8-amino-7-oxononanoate aminotransferase